MIVKSLLLLLSLLLATNTWADEIYTSKMEFIKDFEIKLENLLKLDEEESNLYMNKVLNKCMDLAHGYQDYFLIKNDSPPSEDWTKEDKGQYEGAMSALKIYYEKLNVDPQKSSNIFTKDREEYVEIIFQRRIGKLSKESYEKIVYDFGWCKNYIDTARMISEE